MVGIASSAKLVDNARKIPIANLLLRKKWMSFSIKQSAVVGWNAIGAMPPVNQVEEIDQISPQIGFFTRVVVLTSARDLFQPRSNLIAMPSKRTIIRIGSISAVGKKPAIFRVHDEQQSIEENEALFASEHEIFVWAEFVCG